MAYRKSYRHHKKRSHNKKRHSNNYMNSTVSAVKYTNKKYMPKVKNGIENVGSKVITPFYISNADFYVGHSI
jgi:hypothetical protein